MERTEPKSQRFLVFLKKISISILIIFGITLMQFYWSMGNLSDHMSSGCVECSFLEDAVFMSFLTGMFLSSVFILFSFIKKIFVRIAIEFLMLCFIWIFWNYSIFVDRESLWSTYDFNAEMYYTLSQSIFPVIILGLISICLLHYGKIKKKMMP